MIDHLTLIVITKNNEETLEKTLYSANNLVSRILIIDSGSTDQTLQISRKYNAEIHTILHLSFGEIRRYALNKAKTNWILVLDSDEVLSKGLIAEIHQILSKMQTTNGFYIPRQGHYYGKPLYYGGEKEVLLRLFKKEHVSVSGDLIHEKYILLTGTPGRLSNPILHYSYRTLFQTVRKFTVYARLNAREKYDKGEKTTLRKLFLNPIHMVWSRFVEDQGYKDGLFRLPLDLAFGYMEFMTYVYLVFLKYKILKKSIK